MAVRGWGGSVAAAIGIAACAGAAQLGLGYGLGIIVWLPAADRAGEAAWAASLAWAAWIAATSTVAGAIGAQRLAATGSGNDAGRDPGTGSAVDATAGSDADTHRDAIGQPADAAATDRAATDRAAPDRAAPDRAAGDSAAAGLIGRISLAVAATVGALVTVALVAVPARAAIRADTFSPQTIAAGYAVIGVLVGLVIAIWALRSSPVATNVIATTVWLWILALVSVVEGVLRGRGLAAALLGVWQITSDAEAFWFRDYLYWPGAALSLGSAFLIGVLAARGAARDPLRRVAAAVSGVAGPLVVAAAYFLAAPRLVGIRAEQVSAHLLAPYAVLAGLAGSVLAASLAQRTERRGVRAGVVVPAQRDHLAAGPVGGGDYDSTGYRSRFAGERADSARAGEANSSAETVGGAAGRTAVADPLWPQGTAPGETTPAPTDDQEQPKRRRFGRR